MTVLLLEVMYLYVYVCVNGMHLSRAFFWLRMDEVQMSVCGV